MSFEHELLTLTYARYMIEHSTRSSFVLGKGLHSGVTTYLLDLWSFQKSVGLHLNEERFSAYRSDRVSSAAPLRRFGVAFLRW